MPPVRPCRVSFLVSASRQDTTLPALEKYQVIILIPSHNEIDTLKKICQDIKKLRLKVIVIDDGSTDGTSYWLKKNQFNYIKNKKKKRF